MKYLILLIIISISFCFRFIAALFYMIWNFEINPVLEVGVKNGYSYKPWDLHLWDWVLDKPNPKYSFK